MKKTKLTGTLLKVVIAAMVIVALGIYYYITIPAINIHSAGTWGALFLAVAIATAVYAFIKTKRLVIRDGVVISKKEIVKNIKGVRIGVAALAVMAVIFILGNILSSPIINAAKYQKLMAVEESDFAEDVSEVDYKTIPLLDKTSASLLGDRKMGSMVDMVSQFEVGSDYTQINYQGTPVRVTPLVYASAIKWITNQADGIPAYIKIDMATQNTECVKLTEGIKYSKGEYFNRYIYRHLRFNYPTYIFDDQIFFEIDDEGTPYWVCPVKKFNIGLFGGQTVGRVVLCNAQTGECFDYDVTEVPQWVDKVYSAELLTELYDYHGILQHGYFNSILGQKDCLKATNGYNYIALDDDVWVYTGVTSVSGDQSNVGFVLMNQRTMETKFYKVEGAIEDSAMSSAEGQVQNLGYVATFPLLLNISDEPTYFMALKDGAGLVKKYAMVNVHKYQWVAIGDTVKECEKAYHELLNTNGIAKTRGGASNVERKDVQIDQIVNVVIEGTTHYYVHIKGDAAGMYYDFDVTNADMVGILSAEEGDKISFFCEGENENEPSVGERGTYTVISME